MSFREPFYKNRANKFLTPAHFRALGRVAAEWGILECVLRKHGSALVKSHFSTLTGNPGGVRHAEIIIILIRNYLRDQPKTAKKLVTELQKVKALGKRRNDLLHAGWGTFFEMQGSHPVFPEVHGKALAVVSRNKGRSGDTIPVSALEIEQLAREISDVRIEINKAFLSLPRPVGRRPA